MAKHISVVINTYNASSQLRETLESVKEFDEILVCDMESTDETREIAREYGAKVVIFPKKDYNICEVARDFAIHSASHKWVLVVDADERIPEDLRKYLYKYIAQRKKADALSLPFRSRFMGKFTSTKGERHIRFFRQDKAYWPPIIHAKVIIDGKIEKSPLKDSLSIEHFDDPTLTQRIEKINRYTDNEVVKRLGRHYSTLSILMRPMLFFLKILILKGSIRDGKRGIIRAYMEAMYQVALLGKHLEYQKRKDI